MIYIGTTGWSFNHWEGNFYPKKMNGTKLEYYSKISAFTELRSTFTQLPTEEKVLNWYNASADDFIYVARMLKKVTFNPNMEVKPEPIREFVESLAPLDSKLQFVLLHFPMKFQKGTQSSQFLYGILDELRQSFDGQLLVETPNRSWQKPEVKDELKSRSACLVGNDKRPIPSIMRDSNLYYLRLLGDKRIVPTKSFGNNPLDREDDIKYWAQFLQFVAKQTESVFVTIDNHFSGNSIRDAFQLSQQFKKLKVKCNGFAEYK